MTTNCPKMSEIFCQQAWIWMKIVINCEIRKQHKKTMQTKKDKIKREKEKQSPVELKMNGNNKK